MTNNLKEERTLTAEELRFWELNIPEPNSGCWLWLGNVFRESKPYGVFYAGGKSVSAHRYSYNRFNGFIPDGMWVLHKCDNPACVNPDHLFLGTSQDNVDDRNRKMRHSFGDRHPRSKITKEDAVAIYLSASESLTNLAQKYGVSRRAIAHIRKGRNWKEATQGLGEANGR